MIFRIIRGTFFKKHKPIKLGRWDYRISKEQEEIKSVFANSDHCGDRICGDPQHLKEIIYEKNEFKHMNTNKK